MQIHALNPLNYFPVISSNRIICTTTLKPIKTIQIIQLWIQTITTVLFTDNITFNIIFFAKNKLITKFLNLYKYFYVIG